MKFRTILACAVLGLVIFNGRLNAAVESDVVGYTTVEITKEYTLLGVSFFNLDDSTQDTIAINDFVTGDFTHGDQLQVPKETGSSYDIAIWNETEGKWCTSRRGQPTTTASTIEIKKGDGVWLLSKSATETTPVEIVLKGRALISATATYNCAQQYRLVSLPTYDSVPVNSTKLEWTNLQHGDQIQIPKSTGNSYDVAVWNSTLSKWCTSRRGQPTTTESTLAFSPYSAAWVVSTSDAASCTYDSTK